MHAHAPPAFAECASRFRSLPAEDCSATRASGRPPFVPSPSRASRPWEAGSPHRSEEHTSELQSLMRISYAVFCLKKQIHKNTNTVLLRFHIHEVTIIN